MSNTAPDRGDAADPAADSAAQPGAQIPDLFPFARMPMWLMLADRPLKERAVFEFLAGHVNEQTGQLTAYPGIATIGLAVKLKDRAVQYAVDGLIEIGAVEVVPTYKDWKTGERTFEPVTDGKANAQGSNTYVPCFSPPGGMFYEGPITLQEWYDERRREDPRKGEYKHMIARRIAEARRREARVRTARRSGPTGGVHVDAPPSEQQFSADPQEGGGARRCTGGVHAAAPPGVHAGAPKEDQGEEDQREGSVRPVADANAREIAPAADAADSASVAEPASAGSPDAERRFPADPTETDGRTETSPPDPSASTVADALLSEPEVVQALSRLDCRPTQRQQLARLLGKALEEGHAPDRVRGYLLAKTRETTSRRITFVIRAFQAEHVADLAAAAPVARADVRDARRAEARRAEARRAPAAPPAPARPAASPVDWLTDEQFAELSKLDRSCVAVTAGQPIDQLRKVDRERLHRIRTRIAARAA